MDLKRKYSNREKLFYGILLFALFDQGKSDIHEKIIIYQLLSE